MTLTFQKNILRYLFQNKTEFLEYLKPELFDTIEMKACFDMLLNYQDKYSSMPNKGNFIEYVSKLPTITDATLTQLKNNIEWIYEPLVDVGMIEHTILEEVKKKMFSNALLASMKAMEKGINSADIEYLHSKISEIRSLSNQKKNSTMHLLRDLNRITFEDFNIYPTYLKGLNNMTALGGFHAPQLIVFMKPPKSFGTGFLIKMACEYMKMGLNIFYPDFENGQENIFMRFKQCMLQCGIKEIDDFNSELSQIKQKLLDFTGSGEAVIKKYAKKKDHFGKVIYDMKKEEMDFQAVFPDYLDVIAPSDSKIVDPRLKSQQVYADAQELNDEMETFMVSVSKMKAGAWEKEWPTADDIAEDKEKIYNAHGVFALMRNEEDIESGLASIIPIVQRQGESYTKSRVVLELDAKNFIIKEL